MGITKTIKREKVKNRNIHHFQDMCVLYHTHTSTNVPIWVQGNTKNSHTQVLVWKWTPQIWKNGKRLKEDKSLQNGMYGASVYDKSFLCRCIMLCVEKPILIQHVKSAEWNLRGQNCGEKLTTWLLTAFFKKTWGVVKSRGFNKDCIQMETPLKSSRQFCTIAPTWWMHKAQEGGVRVPKELGERILKFLWPLRHA